MDKKLTAIEAMEKSLDMWTWLALNGGNKQDYAKAKGISLLDTLLNCYLCEYVSEVTDSVNVIPNGCKQCPMFGLWGGLGTHCEDGKGDNETIWLAWANGANGAVERAVAAVVVANAIAKRLEAMKLEAKAKAVVIKIGGTYTCKVPSDYLFVRVDSLDSHYQDISVNSCVKLEVIHIKNNYAVCVQSGSKNLEIRKLDTLIPLSK